MNSTQTDCHSNNREYQCEECNFVGKAEASLKHHVTTKHAKMEEKRIWCDISGCNFRTTKKEYLIAHIRRTHAKNKDELKVYPCSQCHYKTHYPGNLRNHVLSHSEERPFVCNFPSCSYRTKTQDLLRRHKERHEPDQDKLKVYSCTFCDYRSRSKQSLQNHLGTHLGDKTYTCDFPGCSYRTRLPYSLRYHRRRHDPDSMFKCDVFGCEFRTAYKFVLKGHQKIHNPERKRDLQCPLCPKTFSEKVCLTHHIRGIHTVEKRATCKFCTKAYSSDRALRLHTAKVHGPEAAGVGHIVKKYKCPACSFCSAYKNGVIRHQQRSHSNVKNFVCDQCEYRTTCNIYLQDHRKRCNRPSQVKLFACEREDCRKRFFTRGDLTHHLNKVHRADKLHKCPHCEFSTNYAGNFRAHVNKQHSQISEQRQIFIAGQAGVGRPVHRRNWTKKLSIASDTTARTQAEHSFKCAFPGCSYSANHKSYLRQHEIRHRSELKNIQCTMCPTKFFSWAVLDQHILYVHSKEKPFKCDQCDYSTSCYGSIQRHKRSGKHARRKARKPSNGRWNYEKFIMPEEKLGVTEFYSCRFCEWTHEKYIAVVRHTVTHRIPLVSLERIRLVFP